jgi:hypothetical protein
MDTNTGLHGEPDKEGNSEVYENHPERSNHCRRGILNALAGKATRGRARTPKVPRLRDETGRRALSIPHCLPACVRDVLWSAMRLRIAFGVGSHFLHNFCANTHAYSDGNAHSRCDGNAHSRCDGNAKSHCDGMPEADTGDVRIV